MIRITETVFLDDRAIEESFVRASGPGGQNVNKVSTAVELRLDLSRAGLADDVRARLARLAGRRLNGEGVLVLTARRHRTQERNRQAAMDALLNLVARAAKVPRERVPTKPPVASRRRRREDKARRARVKRSRVRVGEA